MSVFDNDTNIYPDLNPMGPQEPQTYRLNKLSKIEAIFLDEFGKCEQKVKKIKLSITILRISYTGLITSRVLTRGISIAVLASGVGMPVAITLGGASLLFSLATPATRKYLKAYTVAREKHDSITLLAQGKLDSIANIISQEMQDGDISATEFHRILQEKEKYHKPKVDINNQAIVKIKKIMKEQQEKVLEQGKKDGEENFYEKSQILQVSRVSMPFKI